MPTPSHTDGSMSRWVSAGACTGSLAVRTPMTRDISVHLGDREDAVRRCVAGPAATVRLGVVGEHLERRGESEDARTALPRRLPRELTDQARRLPTRLCKERPRPTHTVTTLS